MNAAALMTADQYRHAARSMIEAADLFEATEPEQAHLIACAQVYALLAISAQAAENREDVPF